MARRKGVHRFDTDQHRAKGFIFNWQHLKFLLKSESAWFLFHNQKSKCCNRNMQQIYYKCIWSFLTIFRIANNHNEDITHKLFNRYSYMQLKLPFCVVYFPFCKKGTSHLLTVLSEWTYFSITLKFWHYKLWIGRVNTLCFHCSLSVFLNMLYLKKKTNQNTYVLSTWQ